MKITDYGLDGVAETPPWDLDLSSPPMVKQNVKSIATDIFNRIVAGEFPFGTRMPAERELADSFGESRATIRQVLDFLETYGAVARRAGSGTFVAYRADTSRRAGTAATGYLNVSSLAETISPFEMNVAESILEPEIVRLATIYMSVRDLTKLEQELAQLEAIVTDAAEFADVEKQFMMTICEGTHNSLIVAMYRIMHEVRRQPQWCANKKRTLTPVRIREAQRALRSLYTALERRDVDTAVESMRLYISTTHEDMIYASPG
ncbi:MAG: FCD domain-containing protein [Hyphomicrobium sp.]